MLTDSPTDDLVSASVCRNLETERDTARDTIAHASQLLDILYDRLRGEVSQDVLDGIEHISMVLNR